MTPDFHKRLADLSDTVKDGWATHDKMVALAGSVFALRPKLCLEIGVYSGRSFFALALAMKEVKSGIVIGIDPWSAEASKEGMEGEHLAWWGKLDHDKIYSDFIHRKTALGVDDVTAIHRCKNTEYKPLPTEEYDILSIDGNHSAASSIYDVENFASRVREGGLLFFDDLNWANAAADLLPVLDFKKLYDLDTGAVFQRL